LNSIFETVDLKLNKNDSNKNIAPANLPYKKIIDWVDVSGNDGEGFQLNIPPTNHRILQEPCGKDDLITSPHT
jgi:hypothetical protein